MTTRLWRAGPEAGWAGPVHVSLTDFSVHRWRDVPVVTSQGLRLRAAWPRMPGAVGLWLWMRPLERRSGSISVWRDEEDLRRFVGWAPHVAIMRAHRATGSLRSDGWDAERFVAADVLAAAAERLRNA